MNDLTDDVDIHIEKRHHKIQFIEEKKMETHFSFSKNLTDEFAHVKKMK